MTTHNPDATNPSWLPPIPTFAAIDAKLMALEDLAASIRVDLMHLAVFPRRPGEPDCDTVAVPCSRCSGVIQVTLKRATIGRALFCAGCRKTR